jgi:hypothetical protein
LTDLRQEAEQLYEQRLEELRKQAEKEKEAERERGIRSYIHRIETQRNEERSEQARREAAQEADELARERHELEERMEAEVAALNRSVSELESLDRRHRGALHRAGRDVGHGHSLRTLLPSWAKHRLGGFNSLLGIPGTHPSGKERTLAERDPLAHC